MSNANSYTQSPAARSTVFHVTTFLDVLLDAYKQIMEFIKFILSYKNGKGFSMSENVHLFGPAKGAIKYQYTTPQMAAAKMMKRKSMTLRRLIFSPHAQPSEVEYPNG